MTHVDHVRRRIDQLDNRVRAQAFRMIDTYRESFVATGRDAIPGEWMPEADIRCTLHHLILRKVIWDRDDNREQVYAIVKPDIDAKVQQLIDQYTATETTFKSRAIEVIV